MYKIVGADQKEYGPVTEEQMRQWIGEGRANAQTITKFEDGPWKPLSTFAEFASLFPPTGLPPSASTPPLTLGGASSASPPSTPGAAIAGLVCSLLGLLCCGPLFSTIGLVLSLWAISQINQHPTQYTGKGLALAGVVLAILGYALFAVLLFTGLLKRAVRGFPRRI
ncbi:MAG: DUF4190 domain-containing protein [Verrucomicrobiota bacterium]